MPGPPQVYSTSLGELVGRVRAIVPNRPATILQDFANDAIRTILDRKPNWSGMFNETLLYVPIQYGVGSVNMTQGSNDVTGNGTSWPTNDIVNTTIPQGVLRTGYQIVTPASMTGITTDSYLLVDQGGTQEIVSVIEVRPTSFVAIFNTFHNPGCTITTSSLCGRQLRLGNTFPIFTITAVLSATELLTDLSWMATSLPSASYTIRQMYYTIASDIKSLKSCVDQAQGIPPLRVDVTIDELNRIDPQRSATGYPQILANRGVNQNGNMQWEIWPASPDERQLRVIYFKQAPKLTSEGDRIPFFMTPTVLFNGMMASALRIKVGPDDPYYDPRQAMVYEQKFEAGINELMLADDERIQSSYANNGIVYNGFGANWQVSHDWDLVIGNW